MSARSPVPGPWWAAATLGDSATCAVCGDDLVGDPMEVLDVPPGPLCGDCAQAREFDQTLWELDLEDPDAGLW